MQRWFKFRFTGQPVTPWHACLFYFFEFTEFTFGQYINFDIWKSNGGLIERNNLAANFQSFEHYRHRTNHF